MKEPMSLVAAGNTYNPCLLILRSKGYELWAEESNERLLWNASKDGNFFMAYSPPELLGIVVLWESYGTNWNQQRPNLIAEVTENASE
jgi:hypothetical protein